MDRVPFPQGRPQAQLVSLSILFWGSLYLSPSYSTKLMPSSELVHLTGGLEDLRKSVYENSCQTGKYCAHGRHYNFPDLGLSPQPEVSCLGKFLRLSWQFPCLKTGTVALQWKFLDQRA